ncbi:MAG: hypothetical protein Q7K37_12460 [Dehalococcoidia bacterium]|nr:hypothetical protein [Dehalococcoidia bacterium]
MQLRKFLVIAVPVIASFALVACTSDNGSDNDPTTTTPVATAPAQGGDTPVGSGDPTPTGTPGVPVATPDAGGNVPPPRLASGDLKLELAPIEGLDVLIRESFPVQYAAVVKSGLPSGCAAFAGIEVEREGNEFMLTVWNTMPSDPNVACTMIYGIAENTVTLGGGFTSGETYTVRAGDLETIFTAQ